MSRRSDALQRLCPTCGALPGQPCVGERGIRRSAHQSRFKGKPAVSATPVDRTAALIESISADAKRYALDSLEHAFAWGMELCESPIEKLFLIQMMHPSVAAEFCTRIEIMRPKDGLIANAYPPPIPAIYLYPQIKAGNYRADFLLISTLHGAVKTLIVECDGHDFHEKTKDQAQRDKARDRYFVAQGYRVLRYTGSELFHDPEKAVYEALQILLEIA
jgi:hypothetical protein